MDLKLFSKIVFGIFLFLLFGVGLFGYISNPVSLWQVVRNSRIFRVQKITVQIVSAKGWKRLPKDQYFIQAAGLGSADGAIPLYGLQLDQMKEKLEKLTLVENAQIERHFPDRLILRLWLHQPKAILSMGRLYYVGTNGEIFRELAATDGKDYPIFSGFQKNWLDENPEAIQKAIHQGLEILDYWENQKPGGISSEQISEIFFQPLFSAQKKEKNETFPPRTWDLTVRLTEGSTEIRLGSGGIATMKKRLQKLQRLSEKRDLNFSQISLLDLRFRNQVVVTPRVKNDSRSKKINKKDGNFSVKSVLEVL